MQSILSTIFPCCFPSDRHNRSSGDNTERTPLLNGERSHSIRSGAASPSIGDSGVATPGSETKRSKRKQNSILPSPSYDAQALKGIIDDFKGKLIAVDSVSGGAEKATGLLLSSDTTEQSTTTATAGGREGKNVTPVHTLRVSLSSSSQPSPATKLVDIWSDTPADQTSASGTSKSNTPASTAILSYSAAVKRGKKANTKDKKGAKPAAGPSVEQMTYETLTELTRTKPLVHDWDLDDGGEHPQEGRS